MLTSGQRGREKSPLESCYMADNSRKPTAFCTRCGAVSYNATLINGNCGRRIGGKRCHGINTTADESDLIECTVCKAPG
jgi:hypothetical protein